MSVPNITADVLKPQFNTVPASSLVTPINPSSISIDTSSILDGFKNTASGINLGNLAAGAAASIGGGLANKYISDGMDTGAGNVLSTAGQLASFIPGPLGWGLSFGLQTLGGLANRAFGYKLNKGNIANVESNINDLTTFRSDASNYDALTSTINNAPVGMTFKNSYIGKDGWARDKVKNMAEDYRNQINKGENFVQSSIYNNADNIGINQMQNLLSNYAAFGGPLLYSKGGSIHIKPENRGKFTETKRRTGKTTEELTHSSNPLTRKRAIFAQNAKKWHHAFGGELGLDGIIKARLALDSHFGNPTARRMTNYDTRSYTFPNGERGNVYVGSYDKYVTPSIQDVDGELKFIENPWSEENWRRSEAQSMKFESPRDADYFARNYKRFAPMMSLYSKGGRLNNNSYQVGQVYDVDEATINKLKNLGYEFDIL